MELSDELLEQIGAYLSGKMTAMEKEQFEGRMEQDTDLRDEVAVHREIKEGLLFMSQKERFKDMHTDLTNRGLLHEDSLSTDQPMNSEQSSPTSELPFTVERPRFGAGWSWFAMAASVVLVLGLGWAVYRYQAQTNHYTQAFNTFFSTDLKPAPIPVSDPDRLGASLADTTANLDSIRLQGAVTSLQRQDMRAALNQLEQLSQGAPGHWQASAEWYLALAYLKNRQPDQAQQRMQQIAAVNGHPYQQEAQRFLQQK